MDQNARYRQIISRSTNGRGMVIGSHMHGLRYLARQVADPSALSVRETIELEKDPGDGPLDRNYARRLLARKRYEAANLNREKDRRLAEAKAKVAACQARMRRRAMGG